MIVGSDACDKHRIGLETLYPRSQGFFSAKLNFLKTVNSHHFFCATSFLPSAAQPAEQSVKPGPHMHSVQPVRWTYPRVLMKPLVDPSAYREQMSPMWRKLDILSDIFDTCGRKNMK